MRPESSDRDRRVEASLPFVEQLARRVAAGMSHSVDIGDLVQDGVIGLIDAAQRFDEARGIKFETFAERRVRGAMIDALRKDAWPRGVRRQRRELEAARDALRRETGAEPSLADLAARLGFDERRLDRTIVRINAIESTSALAKIEPGDDPAVPAVLVPSEPEQADTAYERAQTETRVRAAIASLPPRERRVIERYYYAEATMKEIGAEIGVNESRVSQLHARAIRRLREALEPAPAVDAASPTLRGAILAFQQRSLMAKASLPPSTAAVERTRRAPTRVDPSTGRATFALAGGAGRGRPARAAGATPVTRACGAEHGWGCPATGPATRMSSPLTRSTL